MKHKLLSPLLAAALAAAVALTAAALPAFADGGEETPITIGQSQEQAECTCTALCTGDSVNADCPVCGAGGADLTACEGLEALPATLSNALPVTALAADEDAPDTLLVSGTDVKNGGYWTTNNGTLTSSDESSWNVHYDASNNTLTLNGATITGASSENTNYNTVGIYAGSSGDVSLEIKLQGQFRIHKSHPCQLAWYLFH